MRHSDVCHGRLPVQTSGKYISFFNFWENTDAREDTRDVHTLIQAVCVVIATSNRVLATPFTLITAHPHSQTHTTQTPHTDTKLV